MSRTSQQKMAGASGFAVFGRCIRLLSECGRFLVVVRFVVVVVMAAVPALTVSLISATVRSAIAYVTDPSQERRDTVLQAALSFSAVLVLSALMSNLSSYADRTLSARLESSVSASIANKSTALALEQFENAEVRDIIQRANQQPAQRIMNLFTTVLSMMQSAGGTIGVLGTVISWNPLIGLLVTVTPLPAVLSTVILSRKYYNIDYKRATGKRETSYLYWLLTSDEIVKEVKSFGLSPFFSGRYQQLLGIFRDQDVHYARLTLLLGGSLNLLSVGSYGAALTLAALSATTISAVGQLTGYLQAMGSLQSNASALISAGGNLYTGVLYASNVFQFLDLPERVLPTGTRLFPTEPRHGVEFRNVSFGYPGTETPVLRDVSFHITPGSNIALVGGNGAGKTTVVKLLLHLYEPDSGDILIDEHPIDEYNSASIRQHMSALFQDYAHYERTLRENVAYGAADEELGDDTVTWALNLAGGDGFAAQCGGLDAMLGRRFPGGRQLSIGQWQKVALARALVSKPSVLILDEPTASMDIASEMLLFDKIRHLPWRPSCLLITHRPEAIRTADRIDMDWVLFPVFYWVTGVALV